MISVIDEIALSQDDVILESTIEIFEEMLKLYDKSMTISDYCVEGLADPMMFYQEEESIIDQATGKHTNDSLFWKIVAFLPRLVIASIKACVNALTNSDHLDADYKKAVANMESMDETQLEQVATITTEASGDTIQFDSKKKTFFLGKTFRHIRNAIYICTGLPGIAISIASMIKNDSNEYKSILKDFVGILTRKKNLDEESLILSSQAFKKLLDDARIASKAVIGISDELGMQLSKKIEKDFKDGKDPQGLVEAQQLLANLQESAKHIKLTTGFIKIGTNIFGGIARRVASKFGRDASRQFSPEYNEAKLRNEDAKAAAKRAKAAKKAARKAEKNALEEADRIAKLNQSTEYYKQKAEKDNNKASTSQTDLSNTLSEIDRRKQEYENDPNMKNASDIAPKKHWYSPIAPRRDKYKRY